MKLLLPYPPDHWTADRATRGVRLELADNLMALARAIENPEYDRTHLAQTVRELEEAVRP